jgi:hypothetical protein
MDMESFFVYTHKLTPAFRLVLGEHKPHADSADFKCAIYQGGTAEQAAQAAYSHTKRADIRTQIARFLSSVPGTSMSTGDETAPAADNSGGTHPLLSAVERAPWGFKSSISGADIWGTRGAFAAEHAATLFTYERARAVALRGIQK